MLENVNTIVDVVSCVFLVIQTVMMGKHYLQTHNWLSIISHRVNTICSKGKP